VIGRRLGHYRILERIGAGGMGVVYRAHDERLDRDIALKLLPHGSLADDNSRTRFKHEALALSRLNHPNIATIHDFDADGGVDFLVMEFVAGTPVDSLIRTGGLGDDELRRIGIELANGLVALHELGIVHRDLKPGNLRLTADGRLKILDFGLARLLQSTSENVTAPQNDAARFAGTLSYMSPEQARGEEADPRTDIYAAGAVLYELAAGRALFPGKRGAELLAAIIGQTPPRPRELNPHLSELLDRTIMRALAKDPSQRHPSAADLRGALEQGSNALAPRARPSRRRLLGGAAALTGALIGGALWLMPRVRPVETPPPSVAQSAKITVAVLPFHGQSVPEAMRFLQVGIPDAIITRLAGLQQLVPRPTSAILRYENQTIDPQEAGRTLASDYVVTGLLLPDAARLRISVQMTRAGDGAPVWGDHYDVARSDLLTVQDRIASSIAEALKIQTTVAERTRLFKRYTDNAAAYELYLQGRAQFQAYNPASVRAAVGSFEGALKLDSRYALARAGIALASAMMRLRFAPTSEYTQWAERGQREAHAALQLDPQLAEAHEALAAVNRAIDFDWAKTLEESGLALALNPHLDQPHLYRAAAFYHLGIFDLVEPALQAAAAGLSPAIQRPDNVIETERIRAVAALFTGRFQEAVGLFEQVKRSSKSTTYDYFLALAYYYTGDAARAEDTLVHLSTSTTSDRRAQAVLASVLASRHDNTAATRLIAAILADRYMDHHMAYSLGAAYAQLGDVSSAIRWLRQAAETGLPCHPWYARDPLLTPLRGNAEFQTFLGEQRAAWRANAAKYGSKIAD